LPDCVASPPAGVCQALRKLVPQAARELKACQKTDHALTHIRQWKLNLDIEG
jgi:hypothetical protein